MKKVFTVLNNTVEIYHLTIWKSSPREGHQVRPAKNISAYPSINIARHIDTPPARERKFDLVGPGEAGFSKENFLSRLPS